MVVTQLKNLCLCVLIACSVARAASCPDGKFQNNSECSDCHCSATCGCDELVGCEECNSEKVCGIGFTGFPTCQIVLETPGTSTISWASFIPEAIQFLILSKPSNEAEIAGAQYDIECGSVSGTYEVKTASIELSYRGVVSIYGVKEDYECTATLSIGKDSSEKGQPFIVSPCTAWETATESVSISTKLQIDVPHHLKLDVYVPEVIYCSVQPPIFELQVKTPDAVLIQEYADKPSGLLGIEDKDMELALDTPYTAQLMAYDRDTHIGNVSLLFTTTNVVPPKVSTASSSHTNSPGAVEVTFTPWNSTTDEGNVSPDSYKVEYRLKNSTYPLSWTSEDAQINGDYVHSSLSISNLGQMYEYRLVSTVDVYGRTYNTPSADTKLVSTDPCEEAAKDNQKGWIIALAVSSAALIGLVAALSFAYIRIARRSKKQATQCTSRALNADNYENMAFTEEPHAYSTVTHHMKRTGEDSAEDDAPYLEPTEFSEVMVSLPDPQVTSQGNPPPANSDTGNNEYEVVAV